MLKYPVVKFVFFTGGEFPLDVDLKVTFLGLRSWLFTFAGHCQTAAQSSGTRSTPPAVEFSSCSCNQVSSHMHVFDNRRCTNCTHAGFFFSFFFSLFFLLVFFETGSCYEVWAGLELTVHPRMASDSQQCACLSLWNAGIVGECHRTRHVAILVCMFQIASWAEHIFPQ